MRQRNGKNVGQMRDIASLTFGALAQLGERLICIQEVIGSIPIGSTRLTGLPGCPWGHLVIRVGSSGG